MSAYVQLNGFDVFDARIHMPRVGLWHADVSVDSTTPVSRGDKVTISFGADETDRVSLKGTVRRGNIVLETLILQVVAGGGGMAKQVPAAGYRNTPLRLVMQGILGAVGEQLSPQSDPGTLATILPQWARHQMSANLALIQLFKKVPDAVWRALPDGSIWVGRETFPPTKTTVQDITLLGFDTRLNRAFVYSAKPNFFPGEAVLLTEAAVLGRNLSTVEHQFAGKEIRSVLWFENQVQDDDQGGLT